jgi:hypothetical protein
MFINKKADDFAQRVMTNNSKRTVEMSFSHKNAFVIYEKRCLDGFFSY